MSLDEEVYNGINILETAVVLSMQIDNKHESYRKRLSKELDKGVDNLWKIKKEQE